MLRLLLLAFCAAYGSVPITNTLSRKLHQPVPTEHALQTLDPHTLSHRSIHYVTKSDGKEINMTFTAGAYYLELFVGPNREPFKLIVDTGSSNTGIPIQGCKTCGQGKRYPVSSATINPISFSSDVCQRCVPTEVGTHVKPTTQATTKHIQVHKNGGFTPQHSKTNSSCYWDAPFPATSNSSLCGFGVTYGTGNSGCGGYLATEVVRMQGFNDLGFFKTTLYMINNEVPQGWIGEGIIGFASTANACNPTCVPTIMDDMIEQHVIEENVLGLCLEPNYGVLDVGGYNASRTTGPVTWLQGETEKWYNIIVKDVKFGQHSIGVPPYMWTFTNDNLGSFLDSGTSIIVIQEVGWNYLNQTMMEYYCPTIPSTCKGAVLNGMILTAREVRAYPDLIFSIQIEGGEVQDFAVPPAQYFLEVGPDQYSCAIKTIGGPALVLGLPFMAQYYIVLDRYNWRVGLAPKGSCA